MQLKNSTVSSYQVAVSKAEVMDFKEIWPCSGLPDHAITFEFGRNGDLQDIYPASTPDGEGLAVLSRDAGEWGSDLREVKRRERNRRSITYLVGGLKA